jgi:FkbM family methyltransferase
MNYKFYGQFDPPLDRILFERYFRANREPGIFIECGAFDGLTECTCRFFEESLGWNGVNVEPSPPIFSELVKNRPNSANVNAALASQTGSAIFHGIIHPDFGELCTNGSIEHHPTHRANIERAGWAIKTYRIETLSWSDLVARQALPRLDLLVLDVEGTELNVIAGMAGCPILPDVFCVEHGHLGVEALRNAIEPLGYQYDGGEEVNSFFVRLVPCNATPSKVG